MRTSNSRVIETQKRQQKGWLVAQAAAKLLLETYPVGYPLQTGRIRGYKKELRSFLSRFAVVAVGKRFGC